MAKTSAHLKIEDFGSNAVGVTLKGNKKYPEHDLFIVKFPGGEVAVTRTTDGEYWIHVIANRPNLADGTRNGGESELGHITDALAHVLPRSNGYVSDIAVRISRNKEGSISADSLEHPELLFMQLQKAKALIKQQRDDG